MKERKYLHCARCGQLLILGHVDDLDEGVDKHYYCPDCGMVVEIYESDEVFCKEYKLVVYVDHNPDVYENFCTVCGNKLKVSGNGCLSDRIDTIECGGDDDKMSIEYHECENCGRSEIRWDNSENEKCLFRYWNQRCTDFDDAMKKVKHYSETMGVSVNPMELPVVANLIKEEHDICVNDFNHWHERYVKYNK